VPSGHQYERELVGIGPDDSLRRLAQWIPPGATVLELGPASGYFTRHLKEVLSCTVDAVEADPRMAANAGPFCRKLVVGDLATLDLSTAFADAGYQVIVAADVIEHLVQPQMLLESLRRFLAPGGQVLISVPNVAYAGLIAALLDGRFDYREEGLLDKTHLRFFTRDSLASLLEASGFHAHAWAAVFRPLNESEFKFRMETLPTALREMLLSSPYALCYQWVVKAGLEPPPRPPPLPPRLQADAFPLRAYHHFCGDDGDAIHEITAWGEVGKHHQSLSIALPAMACGPIRLNLSDRPGFLRIHGMTLLADGLQVWSWRPEDGPSALTQSMDGVSLVSAEGHVLATLHRAHASLRLNIDELNLPDGGVLIADIGWPMSADYRAATAAFESSTLPAAEGRKPSWLDGARGLLHRLTQR
jgi:O-antigen biosynthesis protein